MNSVFAIVLDDHDNLFRSAVGGDSTDTKRDMEQTGDFSLQNFSSGSHGEPEDANCNMHI